MNAKLILVGLVSVVALELPRDIRGQDWLYGGPYSSVCWGYGWPASHFDNGAVPYFSLHPPVYYSYRVARTYGYSPFAYPPGVLTPGSEPPRPAVAQNVYTMPEGAESAGSQQGRQPLRIDNPFVEQSSKPGVTSDRQPFKRQPQVVYPTAVARRTN